MKNKPNQNLWGVSWTSSFEPWGNGDQLLICAPNPATADAKARRYLEKNKHKRIRITAIKHQGMIDVF